MTNASALFGGGGGLRINTVPEYQSGTMIAPQIPQKYTSSLVDSIEGNIIYNLDVEHDFVCDSIVASGVTGGITFGIYEKATDTAPAALGANILEQALVDVGNIYNRTMLASGVAIKAGSYWATLDANGTGNINQFAYESNRASGPGQAYPDKEGKSVEGLAYKSSFHNTNEMPEDWPTIYNNPYAHCFNADGTKFFWVGVRANYYSELYSATLSVPYDLKTLSVDESTSSIFDEQGLKWASYPPKIIGMGISADGLKLMFYIASQNGTQRSAVLAGTLAVAHDAGTLSFNAVDGAGMKDMTTFYDAQRNGVQFSADGSKFFMCQYGSFNIHRFTFGVGWDESTFNDTPTDTWVIPDNGNDASYFNGALNPDLNKFIVTYGTYYGHSGKNFRFYEYSVTPGSATVSQLNVAYLNWTNWDTRGWIPIYGGGLLHLGGVSAGYYQFTMPTDWSISGISQVGSITSMTLAGDNFSWGEIPYKVNKSALLTPDGTEYWTMTEDGKIGVFPLDTSNDLKTIDPFDYSSIVINTIAGASGFIATDCHMKTSPDGMYLFVSTNALIDGFTGWIYRFEFGVAWDRNTLAYSGNRLQFNVDGAPTTIAGFCISPDGLHMYTYQDAYNWKAFKYETSVAWSMSHFQRSSFSGKDAYFYTFGFHSNNNPIHYNSIAGMEFGPDNYTMYAFGKYYNTNTMNIHSINLTNEANLNGGNTNSKQVFPQYLINNSELVQTSFQFVGTDLKYCLFTDDKSKPYLWNLDNSRDINVDMKAGALINAPHNGLPRIYLGVK
ncbi:MAG: hypothetical protein JKY34_10335 [Kordiimonadaceae bacterium]|nr:hypothetical protein [Kordiimonadaceae bacterium]